MPTFIDMTIKRFLLISLWAAIAARITFLLIEPLLR